MAKCHAWWQDDEKLAVEGRSKSKTGMWNAEHGHRWSEGAIVQLLNILNDTA